ncbi:hypothetical protein BGZ94_003523 [Podila epigama]|nr:hypothetical protein BGZ94_003523 [Podila epigama]
MDVQHHERVQGPRHGPAPVSGLPPAVPEVLKEQGVEDLMAELAIRHAALLSGLRRQHKVQLEQGVNLGRQGRQALRGMRDGDLDCFVRNHVYKIDFSHVKEKKVLMASKAIKHRLATKFAQVTDFGKKVDCAIMWMDIELSNIEFKEPEVSAREAALQNRKNIRLGRCIQQAHAKIGVKAPKVLMGDVRGFVGVLYQVRPVGPIMAAGRLDDNVIQIPQTAGGLATFLSGPSLAIMFNFLEQLEEQGRAMEIAKEQHEAAKEAEGFATALSGEVAPQDTQHTVSYKEIVSFSKPKKRPHSIM